jgi:DNA modification methylase
MNCPAPIAVNAETRIIEQNAKPHLALPMPTEIPRNTVELMTCDALHALAKLPDNSVDGGVIDPPYGKKVRGFRWDLLLPHYLIWVETHRVLKPGAHIAVFCFPDMAHRLAMDLEKAGFEIRNVWVWHYPNGLPATQPLSDEVDSRLVPGHEAMVIARKKTDCKSNTANVAKWGTGGLRTKNTLGDGKMSTTVFAYNKPTDWERELGADALPLRRVNNKPRKGKSAHHKANNMRRNFHYCVKPVALLTHLFKLIAKPGDTVIDPFMGSGSAGMAAVWAGMNYIGVDMNPDFVGIAKERIAYAQSNPIPDRLVPRNVKPAKEKRAALPAKRQDKPTAMVKEPDAAMVVSANRPVDESIVAVGRHTEQAVPTTGLRPDSTNLPLDDFRIVQMPTLVFDNKYAPVRKHRHKIRVKLIVRELEPEGRLLPVDVPDPVANLVVPVEVKRTIELLATGQEITDEPGVVFGELRAPGVGLIRGVGLFVKDDGQVGTDGELGGVGGEKGVVLPHLALPPKIVDQGADCLPQVILVASENRQINACGDNGFDGPRDKHNGAWLGDVGMKDAGINPVGEFGNSVPNGFPYDARKIALDLLRETNLNRTLRPDINLPRARGIG